MRKKSEVQRELSQELDNLKALNTDASKQEEKKASMEKVKNLTNELNEIVLSETAEKSLVAAKQDEQMAKAARAFSYVKFIRELAGGKGLTGLEAELSEEAANEARSNGIRLQGAGIPSAVLSRDFSGQNAGTLEDGGYLVDTTIQYQEALRKKLVLTSAGANYMGALTGNIDMVDGMAIKARWGAENGEIESTKKSFSTRSISPLRLGINVPVSKQLILQASKDVEQIIMADMIAAHAEALETAALNGTGTGYEPKGLLNTDGIGSVSIGTNGGIPTFENIVALETAVANANADLGSLAYVTNTKVRGAMKTVLKSAGVGGYIWENNEMNGYKAFASNCVPDDISKGTSSNCSAIIFGNWNDLWICQWGGLDVVVDPYTLKTKGAIDIMLNAYHNIFVKRGESFAAIKDATV